MLGGRGAVGPVDDDIGLGKAAGNITFFHLDVFQQVAIRPALVQHRCNRPERRHRIGDSLQRFVVNPDQLQRPGRNDLAVSGDDRHRITAVAHFFITQHRPVKVHDSMTVAPGNIRVCQHGMHTGQGARLHGYRSSVSVHAVRPARRVRAYNMPGKLVIVGEFRLAANLGQRIRVGLCPANFRAGGNCRRYIG